MHRQFNRTASLQRPLQNFVYYALIPGQRPFGFRSGHCITVVPDSGVFPEELNSKPIQGEVIFEASRIGSPVT